MLKKEFIANFSKYSYILSIGLLLGAIMYEGLYYNAFGIDIFSYTSFTEIVTLFISLIPMLLTISIVVVFFIFIISKIFEKTIIRRVQVSKYNRNRRRAIFNKNSLLSAILLAIFTAYLLLPTFCNGIVYSVTYFNIKVLITWLFLFWIFSVYFYSETNYVDHSYFFSRYVILIGITFYLSIYYAFSYKIWSMKMVPEMNDNVRITMIDKSVLQSSDSLLFVGKTNNYFFFHSLKDSMHSSTILKMSDVQKIEIKKQVKFIRIL